MYSPPPKVTYRVPDQPVEVFYGRTRPLLEDQDISTPRRKTRVERGRLTRKRPHSNSKEDDSFGHLPECMPDSLWASVNKGNDDNRDNRPSDGIMCDSDEHPPQKTDLAYAGFVEAVLSDECSFYQLSRKTFVANGWNPAKNEANVRVTLESPFTRINQVLSLHGITSEHQPSMIPVQLVFARWAN